MSIFTPGPWNFEMRDGVHVIFAGDESGERPAPAVIMDGSKEEREANAHLIAAAPDMYAEAEYGDEKVGPWLSAALDDDNACEEFKTAIRKWLEMNANALAKARGEK